MSTILLTSVGNDGAQAIMAALREPDCGDTLIGVDASPGAYGLYLADKGYVVPPRSAPSALIERLRDIIGRHRVDLILPLSTEDQSFYAAHALSLAKGGCVVLHSPPESVRIANDKLLLLPFLRQAGIAVPRFRTVDSREALENALDEFDAKRQPVVIKRAFSTGASGVKIVLPAMDPLERLFSRDNIRIPLDDFRHWLDRFENAPPALQVSEYLPDARYSVDVFLGSGHAAACVRTEDERLYGSSVRGMTIADEAVETLGVRAARALSLRGTVNVEIGKDAEGVPRIMEINPRFPASIDHTVAAGCNMPRWTVQEALGRPYAVSPPRSGVRYYRRWMALCRDGGECGSRPKPHGRSFE